MDRVGPTVPSGTCKAISVLLDRARAKNAKPISVLCTHCSDHPGNWIKLLDICKGQCEDPRCFAEGYCSAKLLENPQHIAGRTKWLIMFCYNSLKNMARSRRNRKCTAVVRWGLLMQKLLLKCNVWLKAGLGSNAAEKMGSSFCVRFGAIQSQHQSILAITVSDHICITIIY